MSERIDITLVCAECEARNYKTTRKQAQQGQLELKKFCPHVQAPHGPQGDEVADERRNRARPV